MNELEDEFNAQYGDPRRCPIHLHVETSSPDGMFDAPCHECESEAWEAYCDEQTAIEGPRPVVERRPDPEPDFSDIPF